MRRTFGNLLALHVLVVYSRCALLEELVSLDAQIDDLRALHARLDQFFHDRVSDIGGDLYMKHGQQNFCQPWFTARSRRRKMADDHRKIL